MAILMLDKGFHRVDIQRNAEETGKLQAAFNPLNRRAFVAKPPVELYLPVMKTCLSMCRKKVEQLSVEPKEKPVLVVKQMSGQKWAIQVGAFKETKEARGEAERALAILGEERNIETPKANEQFYRARIQGFETGTEAKEACRKLQKANMECFAVSPS